MMQLCYSNDFGSLHCSPFGFRALALLYAFQHARGTWELVCRGTIESASKVHLVIDLAL
jgi:hypothetical protein